MIQTSGWIPEYEGLYKITSDGFIYTYKWEEPRLVAFAIEDNGATCQLSRKIETANGVEIDRTKFFVDRLVWYTFTGEKLPKNIHLIHKDGNILNNNIKNLRRATNQENNDLNGKNRVNIKVIETITGNERMFHNITALKMFYDIDEKTIRRALRTGEEIEILPKAELL